VLVSLDPFYADKCEHHRNAITYEGGTGVLVAAYLNFSERESPLSETLAKIDQKTPKLTKELQKMNSVKQKFVSKDLESEK